jgi:hypothetical protein
MVPQFDIFRLEGDGSLHWYQAACSSDEAEAKVRALMQSVAASYVVFDHRTGHRVRFDPAGKPGALPAEIG